MQALLALAARAPAATFSATYTSGADRVVVHQRPPRRRVDVTSAGGGREAIVIDGDGAVLTCRHGDRRWRCSAGGREDDALGAFSPELVARTVEALEAAAGHYRTGVGRARIAGVAATCLRSTPLDAASAPERSTAQLCVAPDGVPLLLDRGDGSPVLRAIAYRAAARAEDVRRPDR